ncbi:pheromone alpha factor receptor [Geosmithia morbida]|uniref:Pheromone alpha factor receptor n=1 Tax=Geosmithia morbida TaxID=1094350 RepID=A0A9P4Z2B6_9HYPO|nr:pheromone alpha factor receptor [Geosmithia morbida]KAF4125968.1 pheromone alpha factor receptor [Geosmithia morbida]
MAVFDPHKQDVRFLGADGKTPIHIPIPAIDAFNNGSVGLSVTYGAQLGACIIMLFVVVIMTPRAKFRAMSTILHILALLLCVVRMSLLIAFFPSAFDEFYNYWSSDYSSVPLGDYQVSIAANAISLLLVIIIEVALFVQARAILHLWPHIVKYTLSTVSIIVTLLTVSWRLAFTVFQSRAIMSAESAHPFRWVAQWSIITNVVSICWYCALFNVKLVIHVITNRDILLRSYRSLTPMEVLVMTNGILMIVPVIFSALEWVDWTGFEAASLILTSVSLILPLGTLVARRLSQSRGQDYDNFDSRTCIALPSRFHDAQVSYGTKSFTTSSNTTTTPQDTILYQCEAGACSGKPDDVTIELCPLKEDRVHNGQVRVYSNLDQHESRV